MAMATRSLAAAALSAALVASAAAADEYFTGDGTAYTLGSVSSGNCNFMSAIPTASTNYAALNNDQWDGLANCGRCAEVSCIDADCAVQNTTAIVQILDRCPECTQGALDLSPTVFKTITGSDPSRLTIQWKFVDCPSPGNVEICLKTGSNANWVAVQPTNFLNGVESVTINGASTSIIDGAYYFLYDTSEVDLSSVKVAITSMAGDTIEDTVSLTAGSCVTTTLQFSSTTSGSSSTTTTTTAPATTTSAPAATTTAPSTTTAAPTSSDEYDYTDDSTGDEADSQEASSSGSSSTTTTAPATTTSAPVSTTAAPVATTSAPSSADDETDDDATSAPSSTDDDETDNDATSAPTTSAPVSTTAAPSADTSKCRVRYRN